MTQEINYERAMDTLSSAYGGLDSLAAGYDRLIAYGDSCRRVVRKAQKGASSKVRQAIQTIGEYIVPATQATYDSVLQVGKNLKNCARGAVQEFERAAYIQAYSNDYREMQRKFLETTNKYTDDHKKAFEAESKANAEKNPLKRACGSMKNAYENVKAYAKIADIAGRAGITPLQAYSLMNGSMEAYVHYARKKKDDEPWCTIRTKKGKEKSFSMDEWFAFSEAGARYQQNKDAWESIFNQQQNNETQTRNTDPVMQREGSIEVNPNAGEAIRVNRSGGIESRLLTA